MRSKHQLQWPQGDPARHVSVFSKIERNCYINCSGGAHWNRLLPGAFSVSNEASLNALAHCQESRLNFEQGYVYLTCTI